MGITANSGPLVSFGITQTSTGGTVYNNEERGPSLWDLGQGTLDPRFYFNYEPGSAVGTKIYGFFGQRAHVDYLPFAASTNALAAAQVPVAGTAVTLVTTGSTQGAFYTTIVAPETGATTGNLIAIDSTAAYLTFGSGGTVAVWNPAAGTGRTINVVMNSTGRDTGAVTVVGRDMYGIKMTETIPFGSTTVSSFAGLKAFKYVQSVTPTTGSVFVSTIIWVGFNDTFGLPLVARYSGVDTSIRLIATSSLVGQNSSGPITVAATGTATSTTGDVRGTYASTTATNDTVRLQISQNITAEMVNGVTATSYDAMFGVAQYSSV
jgi:hypothetical protein